MNDWPEAEGNRFIQQGIADGLTDEQLMAGAQVIFDDHDKRYPWVAMWMGTIYTTVER